MGLAQQALLDLVARLYLVVSANKFVVTAVPTKVVRQLFPQIRTDYLVFQWKIIALREEV